MSKELTQKTPVWKWILSYELCFLVLDVLSNLSQAFSCMLPVTPLGRCPVICCHFDKEKTRIYMNPQ